ncbi:NAD-dependent epimerase/dehydratase family protein [Mesorhizobium sp. M0276]|uniref:NAD-dependent epimerase/dehydratase family protein n=1 Tax=Mesorhizobium sp. M0276 TaxID=2956928 RepID=UPI00333C2363
MGRKCVVFGGGGFIGSHISRRLSAEGLAVTAFGRRQGVSPMPPEIAWSEGDFRDKRAVNSALHNHDTVFHLVHATWPATADMDIAADILDSVIPSIDLLDACVRSGVKRLIYFSSGGTVYGAVDEIPITEDSPANPVGAYGISKLMIEHYVRLYERKYGLNCFIVRLANPFGPWQIEAHNQGLVAFAGRLIQSDQQVTVYGDGSARRDYVYVEDVADFAARLINYNGSKRIFNVGGGGNGQSILDVIHAIETSLGKTAKIKREPSRPFDVPSNVLSIERAEKELGWRPATSFFDGIDKTLSWQREFYARPRTP